MRTEDGGGVVEAEAVSRERDGIRVGILHARQLQVDPRPCTENDRIMRDTASDRHAMRPPRCDADVKVSGKATGGLVALAVGVTDDELRRRRVSRAVVDD